MRPGLRAQVGAATETELEDRKLRIEDAKVCYPSWGCYPSVLKLARTVRRWVGT